MTYLWVAVGGAVGAPLRYLLDRLVQRRHATRLPWGTVTVNVLGSLLLGGLAGAAVGGPAMAVLGVGLCGALTTYSTFSYETVRLWERHGLRPAAVNVLVSVVAGLAAAAVGFVAGAVVVS